MTAVIICNKWYPINDAEEMRLARSVMRRMGIKSLPVYVNTLGDVPYKSHMVFSREYPPVYTKKRQEPREEDFFIPECALYSTRYLTRVK